MADERSVSDYLPSKAEASEAGAETPVTLLISIGLITMVALLGLYGFMSELRTPAASNALQPEASAETEQKAVIPAAMESVAAPPEPQAKVNWQTPERSVFLLAEDLPTAIQTAIEDAIAASGLPVVERQRIDALLREMNLIREGYIAPASSAQIGRMLGGHVAVLAQAQSELVRVRAVMVETGELLAAKSLAIADIPDGIGELLDLCRKRMPARGLLRNGNDGSAWIDLGSRWGIQAGDRFAILAGDPRQPGTVLTAATVTAVERDKARVHLEGPVGNLPLLARKQILD